MSYYQDLLYNLMQCDLCFMHVKGLSLEWTMSTYLRMICVNKGCFQTDLPVELIFGAEGLVAVGLGTVERFLSCVTECVDLKLIL